MPDDKGKVPEQYLDRGQQQPLKVADLKPEHGHRFIQFQDIGVDHDNRLWVDLEAVTFGADHQSVAPIIVKRDVADAYLISLDGLPADHPRLVPAEPPPNTNWANAEYFEAMPPRRR